MSAATIDRRDATVPVLGPGERAGAFIVAGLACLLGLIGFVNSFERVESAVAPSFGGLPCSSPWQILSG